MAAALKIRPAERHPVPEIGRGAPFALSRPQNDLA
jgi:hypothetical protein